MRKNILIFGHSYAPQFVDINNQYTKLFDPAQYHVTVMYLSGPGSDELRQRHLAEEVIFMDTPRHSMRGLKLVAIRQLLQLQKAKQFQVVICHRYKPAFIMLVVAKFYTIPAVFFVMHELGVFDSVMRKLTVRLLNQSNMLFAGVSNAVRNDIRKALPFISENRIITLYNMIDTELTEPNYLSREVARKELGIADETFLFGNVGRLVINKDQSTLLKAFAKIKPVCPKAQLIIMGSGPLEAQLKQLAQELNIDSAVIFAGFVVDSFSYMKAFDVFVLSSIQEAFGRVLLEGMLAKNPIIATRVNGIPEVVGEAGCLVTAGNVVELSDALLKFSHAPKEQLVEIGNQGYQRAINEFSIEQFKKIFWQLPIILKTAVGRAY